MKRFSYNGTKLKNPLSFDEEIQIDAEYMSPGTDRSSGAEISKEYNHVYNLYAVIVHEGYSTSRGHYYSYIKNDESGIWYKYDDDEVKPVGKDLNGAKRFTQNAYILFYKKSYLNFQETEAHMETHEAI